MDSQEDAPACPPACATDLQTADPIPAQATRPTPKSTASSCPPCTAAHTRPGEWQARIEFASGSGQHSYRLQLQPQRQRQGWAVVDITPEATSS